MMRAVKHRFWDDVVAEPRGKQMAELRHAHHVSGRHVRISFLEVKTPLLKFACAAR
jgi:hypothetical protein